MTGRRRARGSIATLAVAMVAAVMLGESPATPQTGSPITAFHSGKVMDVSGASNLESTPIIQWTPNGGTNQQWRLLHFSNVGPFELVIIQTLGSKKVLDVDGGSTVSGVDLVQRSWAAQESQLWIAYPFGSTGYSLLINVKSGKVADVQGASIDNGAHVIQWDWNAGFNQLWTVPPVTTPPTTATTGGGGATTTTTTAGVKANPTLTGEAPVLAPIGSPITDQATLTGGNNPTGTMSFRIYTDDACATTPVFTSTKQVNGNGNYTSDPFTATEENAYLWVASYSGDANNNPAATACGDENQVSLGFVE